MARKRISEFRAKTLLYKELEVPYNGVQITNTNLPQVLNSLHADRQGQLSSLNSHLYVVKVDQGIKGRLKKGLVMLHQTIEQIPNALQILQQKGYSQFLLEEMTPHEASEEKYVSIERTREGYKILYSETGGVNIEQQQKAIQDSILPYDYSSIDSEELVEKFKSTRFTSPTQTISDDLLNKLLYIFEKYYFSFLEINPYVLQNSKYHILDAAVEVDSTAAFFVNNAWSEHDYTDGRTKEKTEEEKNVQQLAENSQAAFSLEVLNPNGSIFMMLSGGGASIVLADEIANLGYGQELANYGEYSGNPNAEETYIYAKNLLSLLLKSNAKNKVLIIAGGVANFTDVRITFKGLIKALEEITRELQKQKIRIFVRRGGPYQEEGLLDMETFLKKTNLLGIVRGPEMVLTDIVTIAISNIKK